MAAVVAFLVVLMLTSCCSSSSAFEFRVGGPRGWKKPTGEESETFNRWAGRNRFHIGDCLHFKYTNDSVLVVNREDYVGCNTANPILKFTDGNTTFWFDRYGYFYFISGEPGHCESGEKLIVRVMVHPLVYAGPVSAPYLAPGGGSGSASGASVSAGPSGAPSYGTASSALKVAAGCHGVLVGLGLVLAAWSFI